MENGVDGSGEQRGGAAHILPIFCFFIECFIEFFDGGFFPFAKFPQGIKQVFRLQVVAEDLSVFSDIDHVEGVYAIPVIDVDTVIDISEDEESTSRHPFLRWHDGMKPMRQVFDFFVCFHIFQEIHAEFIQPEVHDGDAGAHVFHIDDFFFELFQLFFAIGEIAFLFWRQRIVITGACHDGDLHLRLDACFQLDVFI